MRFKCPQCKKVINLGDPKPGKYAPRCPHCSMRFKVTVSDDAPPKVRVRQFDKKPSEKPSSHREETIETVRAAVTKGKADLEKSRSSSQAKKSAKTVHLPTQSSATGQNTRAQAVDVTVDAPATTSASQKPTVRPQPSSATEATMDQVASKPSSPNSKRTQVRNGDATEPQSKATKAARPSRDQEDPMPDKLGGYRLVRLLGRGGMGAVYEAKQLSLDRLVALKTIRGRIADNPSALARFTREAYAAAQLNHHNVTQIYDFGEDQGQHFFSMEWVRGGPLSDVVKEKGMLDPRRAAGYILQAARGLQFAHQHGMVHRDVKPANLLLDEDGVVKVADLGLVKTPDPTDPATDVGSVSAATVASDPASRGTEVTSQGSAMGTPSYMAPEQSVDATSVDHRADIYSLACTLFYLLSGKPPFGGPDVSTLLSQHAKAKIPSAAEVNTHVPKTLDEIIRRGMAKRPDERYESLADMISELENYLGIQSEGDFSPSTDQADELTDLADRFFKAAPLLRLKSVLTLGFLGGCAAATVLVPIFAWQWILFGPAMGAAGFLTTVALGSMKGSSALATSLRRWVGSLSWFEILFRCTACLVVLTVALLIGMWPGLLTGVLFGTIVGAAYHFVIIEAARGKRKEVIDETKKFVRNLRIQGADEEGLRSFTARYSGSQWQGLFEELFGYTAMAQMRDRLAADPSSEGVPTKRDLRDWLCSRLNEQAKVNKEARDQKRLAKIEEEGLKEEGISDAEARQRAWQMAAAVMDASKLPAQGETDPAQAAAEKRRKIKAMLAEARSGKYAQKRNRLAVLDVVLGPRTRLLVGIVLLGFFGLWVHQTGLVSGEQLEAISSSVSQGGAGLSEAGDQLRGVSAETSLLGWATNGWSLGFAGLLMVASSMFSGWFLTPVTLAAVAVTLFGASLGIPEIELPVVGNMQAVNCGVAGVVVMLVGCFANRFVTKSS